MGLLQWLRLRRPNIWEPPTLLDHLLHSPLRLFITHIYHLLLLLRGAPFRPPTTTRQGRAPIRVVCLADTHGRVVPDVPDGDLLIHAGDLTDSGSAADLAAHMRWLAALPHRHKVLVAGNHDRWFDVRTRDPPSSSSSSSDDAAERPDFAGLHYLQHGAVTLDFSDGRKLHVYGAADTPARDANNDNTTNAFQYPPDKHPWAGRIPPETDILVTHTPPRAHLDLGGLGCPGLLAEAWRVRPRLHVFGHVHWGRGRESVYFDECQRAYEALMAAPPPRLARAGDCLAALRVVYHGLNAVLFKYLMLGPGSSNRGSLMVNAACMHGNTGRLCKNAAQVVDI